MRNKTMIFRKIPFILLFLGFLFFPFQAKGQEAYKWQSLSSLENYKGPKEFGVYVEGKFKISFGESFLLCGVPLKFRITYTSPLYRFINNRLTPKSSNVRVVGNLMYTKNYKWYFEVINVTVIDEDDKTFFENRIRKYTNSPRHLYDLAFLARILVQECRNEEMEDVAKEAIQKAVAAELATLDPKEFERRYAIAQVLEKRYKLINFSFQVYRQCWNLKPKNRELAQKLADLGGKFYQGKWLLEEEIKKLSGLAVSKKGEWMVQEKLLFKTFYEKNNSLPKERKKFRVLGKNLYSGMTAPEITKILQTWPTSVWRTKKNNLQYNQWVLGTWNPEKKEEISYYLYFIQGKLADVKKKTDQAL